MLYIFTALYDEAYIFIKRYSLKKVTEHTRFQHFYSEDADIRLTVTGAGEIAAAATVAAVCTAYKPGQQDFLCNIGTCARICCRTYPDIAKQEGIFLIHKITEQATGKTFYPDVLYRHSFLEESLLTGMLPYQCKQDKRHILDGCLYDMEAAAVYQAGSSFFGPHQMIFLKTVSDCGDTKGIFARQIRQAMECGKDMIFAFLDILPDLADDDGKDKTDPLEKLSVRVCADMHCSKVMENSLKQYLNYLSLAGMDYETVIQEMYSENKLPCKDKREGKKVFEELKKRLL